MSTSIGSIAQIGDFRAETPIWNDHAGWRTQDEDVTALAHVGAVPLFGDGCGNLYGLDLTSGVDAPAVYPFDHERGFAIEHAAGSSLGAFLLLLADMDRAYREGWPSDWPLKIDPDIVNCPRAPAML